MLVCTENTLKASVYMLMSSDRTECGKYCYLGNARDSR